MTIRDEKMGGAQRGESYTTFNDETPDVVVSDGFREESLGLPEFPELGAEEDIPPAYSEQHDQLKLHQAGFDAGATITSDGRIDININQTSRDIADIIAPTLRRQIEQTARVAQATPLPPAYIPPSLGGQAGQTPPPKLNVVIQIVGSRGDVQPFVALGQVLRETYGHRVRIATHPTFKKFVEENGLEFFSIGGDPAELMAFMVKNPGLMPGFDAITSGEVTKRRKGIEQIVWGCWRSCIEAGDGSGPAPRPHRTKDVSVDTATTLVLDPQHKPFVADVIIANPPSFAHIHCAEKLGIPLHLMFTMPWSPTRAFPQPLANIQSSNTDPVTTNYVSYALVEMMTWQGLGDVINRFRSKVLNLQPLSLVWAPGVLTRLQIPYTYCWSPALIPKPNDWGQHIDIAGFFFLNLASNYTPDPELAAFLEAGPPPVYIGFGSIVVDDPTHLTKTLFEAIRATGVRALVSKGWGGLGADDLGKPDGVYMLGNVPHDWLFKHVSAVCHHGGAGTTAAGINAGKPTIIVPFFGDQPFWGAMVHRAGAGPEPIPYKKLTAETLAEAIQFALKPDTLTRAEELGAKIREEKGSDVGGQSFHAHLDLAAMRCSVVPSRVAVWRVRRTKMRLSGLAAAALVNSGYLQYTDLKLYRPKEYNTEDEPWDPISAVTSALLGDIGAMSMAIADFPRDIFRGAAQLGQKNRPTTPQPESKGKKKAGSASSKDAKSLKAASQTDVSTTTTETSQGTDTPPSAISALAQSTASLVSPSAAAVARPVSALDPDDAITAEPRPVSTLTTTDAVELPAAPPTDSDNVSRTTSVELPGSTPDASVSELTPSVSNDSNVPATEPLEPIATPRAEEADAAKKEEAAAVSPNTLEQNMENIMAATTGASRFVTTGIKTPMNFCLGLARGFRNVPRLYNDDTVRPVEKVTDLTSGLKVAGKEFGLGLYDGITGLVTQPLKGAEKEGAVGFVKGFGKGIAGVAMKPAAGFWGLPAYAMAGLHAEIQSQFAVSAQNYIVASRISQGNEDFKNSTAAERDDIEVRWLAAKDEMKAFYTLRRKEKGKEASVEPTQTAPEHATVETETLAGQPPRTGWRHTRNLSYDERKRIHEQKKLWKQRQQAAAAGLASASFIDEDIARRGDGANDSDRDEEYERAIETAVRETSRGDAMEDARIEQAIRSSVMAFRRHNGSLDSFDSTFSGTSGNGRSTAATSVSFPMDVKGGVPYGPDDLGQDLEITDEEYQNLIEQAVQQSIAENRHRAIVGPRPAADDDDDTEDDEEFEMALQRSRTEHAEEEDEDEEELNKAIEASKTEPNVEEEDEEELSKAIEASKTETAAPEATTDEEEELRRAMEESERAHQEELARATSLRTEEDIVMEYVKKQSLAEEELRKKSGKGKEVSGDDEDEDEELKRALEESLKSEAGRKDKWYPGSGSGGNGGGSGSGSGSGSGVPAGVSELPG